MSFEDLFSTQAATYAAFRPRYPDALFDYLAEVAPAQHRAVDCGAGSGQAAIALARSFDEVIAIEPSHAQVTHAAQHERVRYVVAPAEQMDLDDASVDLIVCANAIHWFDLERFYPEARRVLRPDGVLAAWCYQRAAITPEIEEPIERYSRGTLDGYWSPRIAYVNEHYSTLPFPFDEIDAPAFVHEAELILDELIGYLGSWSATRAYIERNAVDPLVALRAELIDAWGPRRRTVRWPLYIRIGRSA